MNKFIALTFIVAVSATSAQAAQRQRDFSLPLNESLQLPTNNGVATPLNTTNQNGGSGWQSQRNDSSSSRSSGSFDPYAADTSNSAKHFMDGYCDQNFTPAMANSSMAQCLKQQKQDACSEFSRMPKDVKRVLNDTIDCNYAASDGDEVATSKQSDCSHTSDARLKMIKKYKDDEQVTHALSFLPETVLEGGSSCVSGR